MRALRKTAPEPGANLEDISVPEPGEAEILVRVHAASICGTDLHIYDWNEWAEGRIRTPMTFGHELAGTDFLDHGESDRTGEVLDRWIIADGLATLSKDHRRVITAAYYEGRSVAEIAAELRVPEGTVKSRLHYGLRSLRLVLQEKGVTRP